nr:MAG TPA: hypothetical protein [Caudoviricetes sp.]
MNGLQFYIIPINLGAMNGIFNCLNPTNPIA